MELKRLYSLLDEKDFSEYNKPEVIADCANVTGLSEKEVKKYIDAYGLKKKEYFYKRMKKKCNSKYELAIRVNLYTMDDNFTASKFRISPKRLDDFLGKATGEETNRIYDDLMALDKRGPDEEQYCITFSVIGIMATIKATVVCYNEMLSLGYTKEEVSDHVKRTPEKLMKYQSMTDEELYQYAMQRVYSYCNEEKTHLNAHFLDMEF